MEQRIATKVNDHQIAFKTSIREWLSHHDVTVTRGDEDVSAAFLQYVYSYKNPTFTEDDFQKRRRTSTPILPSERCGARRSNNEQCSRRRKKDGCFCGTHAKGTPNGIVCQVVGEETLKRVEIRTVEINGIYYYVDSANNVYSPEDIVNESEEPMIIGKYENGQFKQMSMTV